MNDEDIEHDAAWWRQRYCDDIVERTSRRTIRKFSITRIGRLSQWVAESKPSDVAVEILQLRRDLEAANKRTKNMKGALKKVLAQRDEARLVAKRRGAS